MNAAVPADSAVIVSMKSGLEGRNNAIEAYQTAVELNTSQ